MDLLLIFPPTPVEERYGVSSGEDIASIQAPLGIAYVAAYLEEKGFKVGIVDAPALNMGVEEIIKCVENEKPAAVGISALTPNFHRAAELAEKIKEECPKTLVILGGQHATIMKDKILREHRCFDIVVYGEGELTACELMELVKKRKLSAEHLKKVKGIVFRNRNKIEITKPREPIQNLDSLPFPARHLLPMDRYLPMPNHYKRKPVANMITIRGCPFQCTFCSAKAAFGQKRRYLSPERVIAEIKHLKKEYGIREISFWDDMLTANKEWINEICDTIINEKIDITWTCSARVDSVNPELLKKMKKAGCWSVFYGIESGSQELLDNIKKGITLEQIRDAVKWTKEAGIEIRGSFMLCLPGETPELARKTIEFAKELDVDYAQFSLTTPYPGTELYETAKKYGHLKEEYDKFSSWHAVFLPFGYKNREEVEKMHSEAFKKFYMRPKYMLKRIAAIRSFGDVQTNLKGLKFISGFMKRRNQAGAR